jgi:hypothetical protein
MEIKSVGGKSVEENVDKPTLSSLSNQGSITLTLGALFILVGEPLSKGIKPEPGQLIGYMIVLAGILMNMLGNRRATGRLINKVDVLTSNIEDNKKILAKLSNGNGNGNNGHDLDDGPTDIS